MNILRAAARLLPVCLVVSCGLQMKYEAQHPQFVKQRDASYFIVNDAKVNSLVEAQNQCSNICVEEGGKWTGTWSNQNPFASQGGVCECSESTAEASPIVQVNPAPMSVGEMNEAFDVPVVESAAEGQATPPGEVNASANQDTQVSTATTKETRTSTAGKSGTVTSQASAGDDVSATVSRDPKTGQVTATAKAGRAKAVAKSPASGEATATITRDPKTGQVTATASAGGATSTASSRKDPFEY